MAETEKNYVTRGKNRVTSWPNDMARRLCTPDIIQPQRTQRIAENNQNVFSLRTSASSAIEFFNLDLFGKQRADEFVAPLSQRRQRCRFRRPLFHNSVRF